MSKIRHGGPSKQTNQNSHQSRYRANKSQPSMPARSRSENPINRSRQGGFTYLPESAGSHKVIHSFHIRWIFRINFTINLVVLKTFILSLDSQRPSTPPPVMPEKTKIHLRSNQPHSLNPTSTQKTTQHSKVKSGHSSTQGLDAPSASKNKRVKDVKSQNAKVKALCFFKQTGVR